jgi:asparagine synthetase B (glutamine-hydrolysing)
MTTDSLLELTAVEAATAEGIGEAENEPTLPWVSPDLHPLRALEEAILPALQRPPCFVLFSGGRDSSAVLAVATSVARREGLPLPIPTSHVFPAHPETAEDDWQRIVLDHLALKEHLRQTFGDELNLLGQTVRDSIRAHGVIAPAGTHLLAPTFEAARSGSVLTGTDGDGLFNGASFGPARVQIATRRPTMRLPLSLARAAAPRRLRERAARWRGLPSARWLRPAAEGEYVALLAHQKASEPFLWNGFVAWFARRRRLVAIRQAVQLVSDAHDVMTVQPLMDPHFLSAMARHGGPLGFGTRTEVLRSLFGSLLPERVLTRATKAVFTAPYWAADVKDFARTWDGSGLPNDLVDVDALREIWLSDRPEFRTKLLLHAAWAATLDPGERPKLVNCRLE